mgnify:CR=1 FL=1
MLSCAVFVTKGVVARLREGIVFDWEYGCRELALAVSALVPAEAVSALSQANEDLRRTLLQCQQHPGSVLIHINGAEGDEHPCAWGLNRNENRDVIIATNGDVKIPGLRNGKAILRWDPVRQQFYLSQGTQSTSLWNGSRFTVGDCEFQLCDSLCTKPKKVLKTPTVRSGGTSGVVATDLTQRGLQQLRELCFELHHALHYFVALALHRMTPENVRNLKDFSIFDRPFTISNAFLELQTLVDAVRTGSARLCSSDVGVALEPEGLSWPEETLELRRVVSTLQSEVDSLRSAVPTDQPSNKGITPRQLAASKVSDGRIGLPTIVLEGVSLSSQTLSHAAHVLRTVEQSPIPASRALAEIRMFAARPVPTPRDGIADKVKWTMSLTAAVVCIWFCHEQGFAHQIPGVVDEQKLPQWFALRRQLTPGCSLAKPVVVEARHEGTSISATPRTRASSASRRPLASGFRPPSRSSVPHPRPRTSHH